MFFSQLNYDHLSIDNFNCFAPEFGICLQNLGFYMFVPRWVVMNCKQALTKLIGFFAGSKSGRRLSVIPKSNRENVSPNLENEIPGCYIISIILCSYQLLGLCFFCCLFFP